MSDGPRIALIHATPVAMAPVHAAMATGWPEARPFDLLDTSLSEDAQSGAGTTSFDDRFMALSRHATSVGAAGILFTCSAFGSALDHVARSLAPLPVLKPNEAMFRAALGLGSRIAMVATFAPAVAEMEAEFRDMAGGAARLDTRLAEGAMAALRAGDGAAHDRIVRDCAAGITGADAIMLAHFSTARAAQAVTGAVDVPVLTSPDSAVQALRDLCST
ncbi:aspartate/glutamate racemase family protein [Oceanomicrobium pacificus]|uniref:Arylsulfatase n=1 Tax=Oceanomicrobium pacificus TaxID=2692916 RepID=A0A6B0TYA6_9RHOB|nr:aspartate/glutamate racemase family protein [Oceanomicrobium pacificus]MXU66034.1 arylsulfatase [Oceanomicrobium pacificus]